MLIMEVLHHGKWLECDVWPNTADGVTDARVYGRMLVADGRYAAYRIWAP